MENDDFPSFRQYLLLAMFIVLLSFVFIYLLNDTEKKGVDNCDLVILFLTILTSVFLSFFLATKKRSCPVRRIKIDNHSE
jgi:hypothetical protein